MSHEIDETLARRFRDGADRAALEEIVGRYERPVYNALLRFLRDPDLAEEAAQETFLRMIRGIGGFRDAAPFRPWLYGIALNTARTLRGRRARSAALPPDRKGAPMQPGDEAVRREVQTFVDDLPDDQREAVILHYYQGLSHSEVAATLAIPPGTAATRIHQALTTLRARLASAVVAGGIEALLAPGAEAAAPRSISKSVLQRAVPIAGAAVVVGASATASKAPFLVAAVIVTLSVGAVIGYQLRAARPAPVAHRAVPAPSVPPESGVSSGVPPAPPQDPPKVTSSARTEAQAPAAAAPADPMKSKYRKLAAFILRIDELLGASKNPTNPPPEEAAEIAALFMKALSDPDLKDLIKLQAGKNSAGLAFKAPHDELLVAMLEEAGLPPDEKTKAALHSWFEARKEKLQEEARAETSIERRILEYRHSMETMDSLQATLTPDQWKRLTFMYGHPTLGMHDWAPDMKGTPKFGVALDIRSGDSASALIESWSSRMTPLGDDEKSRLRGEAELHAKRLEAIYTDYRAKYGDAFMEALKGRLFAHAHPDAPVKTYAEKNPDFELRVREAYLRLLAAELENRRTLAALLPDRADAVKKATPHVYLLK
jgi:RNA polymerase sigma-70 factor (ECF subfamily)